MFAVAQFSLFQLLYNIAAKAATIDLVLDGMIIALMLILAAGIYFRQRWAYVTSMVILPVVVFIAASRVITNFPIANLIRNALGDNAVMANLASAIISPVVDLLIGAVKILQIITALGAAFLAVLGVSADFDRVTTRLVARVEKSFKEASQYYSLGQTYARRGMWAGAILHWQRAVAKDPVKITYHRALGEAYARLGFYERSLDVLQTALQSTTKPAAQADLEQLIQAVRQRQERELAKSAA
jgi:tetratricopeptide (TPR) repeat protein